ncbi:MAG TPA: hypothetical protein VFJ58_08630, partial [Armatimonadota bacterium]|nr:hypothetical protein [Armatimonadota bacterium]
MLKTTKHLHRLAAEHAGIHADRATRALIAIGVLLLALPAVSRLGDGQRPLPVDGPPPPVRYTVTDLGDGGARFDSVSAHSINDRGQVACGITAVAGAATFLWQNGRFTKLGPGRLIAPGRSLNNRGEVVGTATNGSWLPHVVIIRGGEAVDTGVLGYGYGIDDESRVVGLSRVNHHAFLYDRGKTIDLGTLGGVGSAAYQINQRGQIVGTAELPTGQRHAFPQSGGETREHPTAPVRPTAHAFLYSDGKMHDLGTLGGRISSGCAINDRGWVAGLSYLSDGALRAFLFRNGKMEGLDDLAGMEYCFPYGINSAGTIAGTAVKDQQTSFAIV